MRLKIQNKKQLRLVIVAAVVVVSAGAYFVVSRRDNSGLTDAQKAENKQIAQEMSAAAVTSGLNPSLIAEADASIKAGKYIEAKTQLEKLLALSGLTAGDEAAIYTPLAQTCLYLRDLDCADKVVAYQQRAKFLDDYFLVAIARIAKQASKLDKAKTYYDIALKDIDAKGGKSYVDNANAATQETLDYNEIKAGAQ